MGAGPCSVLLGVGWGLAGGLNAKDSQKKRKKSLSEGGRGCTFLPRV